MDRRSWPNGLFFANKFSYFEVQPDSRPTNYVFWYRQASKTCMKLLTWPLNAVIFSEHYTVKKRQVVVLKKNRQAHHCTVPDAHSTCFWINL